MKSSGKLVKHAIAALFFALGMCACSAIAEELVINGSFERYEGSISRDGGKYENLSGSLVLEGWEPSIGDGSNIGLSSASDTDTWKNVSNVKGEIACYFQRNCSLSQKITVTKPGLYWISFRYASRLQPQYYGNGRFYIEIDGTEIGHVDSGTDTTFRTALMEAYLSAGEHTLVVRHSNELSTDNEKRSNSVIDGISITPKTNLLFNGGFEHFMGVMPSAHHVTLTGSVNADGWTTGGGLSEAGSPFLKGEAGSPFEGSMALHFNGVREIAQSIKVPETGSYQISFVYAPRNLKNYAGGRVHVWIDGTEVGYVDCSPTTMEWRRYMVKCSITAGNHVFKLSHTCDNPVSAGHTPCSALDDVSIKESLLLNGDFDGGAAGSDGWSYSTGEAYSNPGWTTSGKCGLAKPGVPDGSQWIWSEIDSGVYSMFTHVANYTTRVLPPVSISQSFDALKAGVYELCFSYVSRPYVNQSGATICARIRKGEGVEGDIVWESSVKPTYKKEFHHFTGRIKLYAAGRYTLEFYSPQPEYVENAENNQCAVLDNVSLAFAAEFTGMIIVVK